MFTDKLLDVSGIIPKHSVNIINHDDAQDNWDYCDNYYDNFKFQLIRVNIETETVYAPPPTAFTELFTDYINDNKTHERMFFKTQWLLSEYIRHDFMHPVQVVYNWKQDWFEVHPGLLRGAIYRLFGVKEFLAFYHPITDKSVEVVQEFTSVNDLLFKMKYTEYNRVFAKLVNYYDKPLYAFHILNEDIDECALRHKDIFFKNIEDSININCPVDIIPVIEDRVKDYPIKFTYNTDNYPSFNIDVFNDEMFHVGLFFLGTKVTYFNGMGIDYSNPNESNN